MTIQQLRPDKITVDNRAISITDFSIVGGEPRRTSSVFADGLVSESKWPDSRCAISFIPVDQYDRDYFKSMLRKPPFDVRFMYNGKEREASVVVRDVSTAVRLTGFITEGYPVDE